ncbi:MAG: winged helix-turn-helix transcriptional regulator [Eggerthellaceae bacterium]|nr:winged helix-turn-helix transcriptional regulator [Eggerthellaceae bacterium]
MNDYAKTLAKMKKAGKLIRLHQHQNGPKSYKRGQGALLRALLEADGTATQRELTATLGVNRKMLKDIVRKAQRNDYVIIEDAEGKKTYAVKLTDEGRKVAEKHEAAQDRLAEEILAALSDEERAQLDAINEKLIVACKEAGIDGKKKGRKAHRHGHRHGHGCCKHRHGRR